MKNWPIITASLVGWHCRIFIRRMGGDGDWTRYVIDDHRNRRSPNRLSSYLFDPLGLVARSCPECDVLWRVSVWHHQMANDTQASKA
jgi:hypothetical protein